MGLWGKCRSGHLCKQMGRSLTLQQVLIELIYFKGSSKFTVALTQTYSIHWSRMMILNLVVSGLFGRDYYSWWVELLWC